MVMIWTAMQVAQPPALTLPRGLQLLLPLGGKLLPEIVHGTKQVKATHSTTFLG